MKAVLSTLSGFSLEKALSRLPITQTEQDRRLLWRALLVNVVAYGVFLTHHMLHNHAPRFPWIDVRDQWHAGRWFNSILIKANYLADMPVLGPLIGILFSLAAGMLVLKTWRLNLTAAEALIALGMMTAFPMCLVYFYYTYQTPLFCIALLFAAIAVFAADRLSAWRLGIAALAAMLAFASYQPAFSVMMTLVVAALIARLIGDEEKPVLPALKLAAAQTVAIGLGAGLYKASLAILKIKSSHATATVPLEALPGRIVQVAQASFEHLTLTQPDLLSFVKGLLAALIALAALASFAKLRKRPLALVIVALSWLALVFATKAMFVLSSDNSFFNYRYNMAMAFLHAFTFAALIHCLGMPALRSIALALGAFLLLRFIQADLVRQEVLFRGEQHDLALANRILTRMESLPDLQPSKTYDLVRIGKYSTFRQDALSSMGRKADKYGDSHMDNGEVTDRWADEDVFIMLGSKIPFKHRGYDPDFSTKMETARKSLLSDRKPWPHRSSVFIHDDTIYIYMN